MLTLWALAFFQFSRLHAHWYGKARDPSVIVRIFSPLFIKIERLLQSLIRSYDFDIFETFKRKFKLTGFANFYMAMNWDVSDFVTQAEINIGEERITLNQKMRTKLTLEQKRLMFDVIERFGRYLKTTAQNFYRYDVFLGCVHYCDGNSRL